VGRIGKKYHVDHETLSRSLAFTTAQLLHDFDILWDRDSQERELRCKFFVSLSGFLSRHSYIREAAIAHECAVASRPDPRHIRLELQSALRSLHERACREAGLKPMPKATNSYLRWSEQEIFTRSTEGETST
jgi:hypothetical protein